MSSLEAIFAKKRQPCVGIDISSSAIKVLEFSRTSKQYRVERFGVEPVPQNAVVEHAIAEVEQVAEAVGRAVKRAGIKIKQVAVAVAGTHVITKSIKMPASLQDQELQTQIEMEADHYIPYPLDEVNLDYQVLGPSEDSPDDNNILLAACRKEIVDDYIAVIDAAGLSPQIIDIETYAMENAFQLIAENMPGGSTDKTVAILDIGAMSTNINVIHDGRSVYTRDHAFGGRQLTEEIQRRYGLSYEEAGLAKKQGGLPDNYQTDVLRPFMEATCQESMRALQFFYSSSPFNNVDQIMLAGGCAQIPGIDELMAARIGCPAMIANPFTAMSISGKVKAEGLSNDAPSLMIACGLALRSFDE